MTGDLIVALGIVLVVMALINRGSKLLTYGIYLFMWVVYTFCNSGNPDLDVYTWTYRDHIYVTALGFDWLMNVFASLGAPFFVFKGFCGLFTIHFYRLTFKKFYKCENAILAMSMVCPLIASISQIRNGMMAAYVLYAFSKYLFDKKHSSSLYIIRIILISVLIHPVGIVYLVLVFAKTNFMNLRKTRLAISILMIIVVELILTQNLLYKIASLFIVNQKYLSWFDYASAFAAVNEETLNIKGKLWPVIEQLFGTGLIVYAVKRYDSKFQHTYIRENNNSFTVLSLEQLKIIKNSFYLLLFVLPFYQISPTYFRVYMNFIPMIYMVMFPMFADSKGRVSVPQNLPFWITIVYGMIISVMSNLGYLVSMFESFSIR